MFEEDINKMAENYKQPVEEFRKNLREEDIEYIKGNIKVRKAIEIIVDNAKKV